ncbi:hypothetical protein BHM08_12665 [Salmonella enterica]|nr:hypothetical protein [Salmonella enterica]EBQ4290343.1 hypothetical protein [Salmonella enterica]EBQ4484508.1 hypothetical protein [Salmonella enterica]EBQ4501970.1 hypothetical protein [Salmonella enterica]ECC2508001.1 hypothetical protein [Salmonella enterica]
MSTESNIIIDGGFEEGFDGWVLSSQSSIFVEDGATGNNHFCRIEPTNTITQYFTIEPETTYRLTLAVRGEGKRHYFPDLSYPYLFYL